MTVFEDVKKGDLKKLVQKGFKKQEVKSIYEEARLTDGETVLTLYKSGKLLVQGSETEETADLIRKLKIGKSVKPEKFRKESGWIIGSDETLKGDTFGGIVVAAVKANKETREKLFNLGVDDSKKLDDKEIMVLAEEIKKIIPCQVLSLLPEEYNKRFHKDKDNVTDLLNDLHQQAAKDLGEGRHIVDKYPGCNIGDLALEKAESKYVEVAAASILARAAALQQLDYLSMQAGFRVPKGSTHVKLALFELAERQLNFNNFVKMHFNNVKEFLASK